MEKLSEILTEIQPISEHLYTIYQRLPEDTLEAEQERLKRQLLEIGAKIVAINEITGDQNEHFILIKDTKDQQAI